MMFRKMFEHVRHFCELMGQGPYPDNLSRGSMTAEPGQNTLMDEANYISTPTGSLFVNEDDDYSGVPNGCVNGFAYSYNFGNKDYTTEVCSTI
eukprot:CAMPEP_0172153556 /NCGR_PEP_ID=MMETSP1050-20130122/1519_1 /TAXON_ID=233186 /ORGANISM="Cryptomonas curvata, Strain CCAP979/52" /LENGTH=92 /DNA_ID=CAMNT_0012822123 /DNA_START=158 /DNA_END=436 /DNA_ORIENTATION=-